MLCFEASAAQITVACAFASLCLSLGTTKKSIFLRLRCTQGQNNKHRQGEAGRCWIHFHGTYHGCREASKLCVLGRLNTERQFLFVPFCCLLSVWPVTMFKSCLLAYTASNHRWFRIIKAFHLSFCPHGWTFDIVDIIYKTAIIIMNLLSHYVISFLIYYLRTKMGTMRNWQPFHVLSPVSGVYFHFLFYEWIKICQIMAKSDRLTQ